jgi:hypothetical protein
MSAASIVGTMRAALVAAALGGLAVGEARALVVFYSGNQLLAVCDGVSPVEKGICVGFISGVADTLAGVSENGGKLLGWRACQPPAATSGQTRDVVIRFLRAHPEKRHLTAASLTVWALAEAWPCR